MAKGSKVTSPLDSNISHDDVNVDHIEVDDDVASLKDKGASPSCSSS